MNKKIVTLLIVILISFCLFGIVVAENATHNDTNTTDNDKDVVKNKTAKDNTHKNKTDNKSKKNYILAKGSGNNIKFSDGYRGFRLDYSKPAAHSGDEFRSVSTSGVSDSNTLKLAIIESEISDLDSVGNVMSDFVKNGSSDTPTGEAVEDTHEKISDHELIELSSDTGAVFDFEVLKSVSGNESDYFAYKVSYISIAEEDINQTTNTTTNITNTTNLTGLAPLMNNGTNSSYLNALYDYLMSLADALFAAWKPLINTLLHEIQMIADFLEQVADMIENFIAEMQALMYALEKFFDMLEEMLGQLAGLLSLLHMLFNAIEQLIHLIGQIINLIKGIISAIISLLIKIQIIKAILALINFILGLLAGLIGMILAFIQAILDFLKSVGSFLINVIGNLAIIITAFVIIAIGAFVYNRRR